MKYFNKKQIEEIKTLDGGKMEYHFSCVINSNFKRGTPSTADIRLYEIYADATGEKLSANGCKTCQFNNYKKVATLYNESKKYWEEIDEKAAGEEVIDMITDMANLEQEIVKKPTKNKTTKPRGRKKNG